ncbi:MAG: hypothetical protein JNK09_21750 [Prolixibacteraceae bacterium]|nr:hypothetical protein [Prolixibacteraceae bacterium]
METLLSKLKLTGISSSNEVVGHFPEYISEVELENTPNFLEEKIGLSDIMNPSEDQCLIPNVWDGECS